MDGMEQVEQMHGLSLMMQEDIHCIEVEKESLLLDLEVLVVVIEAGELQYVEKDFKKLIIIENVKIRADKI